MAIISSVDARNFFEVSILLKNATPSVTWYGSLAMQNGGEQRTLNDCIKTIEKAAQAARTDWSVQNEVRYKIMKDINRIQELGNKARKLIETRQVGILARFFYHIQGCFSWIFTAPETNAEDLLERAVGVNRSVVRDHLTRLHENSKHRQGNGYSKLKESIIEGANRNGCASRAVRFMKIFEALVPENKRTRERFFACAQMEVCQLKAEHKEEDGAWLWFLNGVLEGNGHFLRRTPVMYSWLLRKVESFSENSLEAKRRWIQPLQIMLKQC